MFADIATGKSNAAIASDLYLIKHAVEKPPPHSIFMKLNLRDAGDTSLRVKATLIFLADEGLPRSTN